VLSKPENKGHWGEITRRSTCDHFPRHAHSTGSSWQRALCDEALPYQRRHLNKKTSLQPSPSIADRDRRKICTCSLANYKTQLTTTCTFPSDTTLSINFRVLAVLLASDHSRFVGDARHLLLCRCFLVNDTQTFFRRIVVRLGFTVFASQAKFILLYEENKVASHCSPKTKLNSMALVRERTIPTERPPPVGEVSANFCG
jgi:hypothetical protein